MATLKAYDGYYKDGFDRCICISKVLRDVLLNYPAIANSPQATHLIQGAISEIDEVANLMVSKVKDNEGALYDRAFWLCDTINDLIAEHPEIVKDHDAKVYADKSTDNLWKLYEHLADKL